MYMEDSTLTQVLCEAILERFVEEKHKNTLAQFFGDNLSLRDFLGRRSSEQVPKASSLMTRGNSSRNSAMHLDSSWRRTRVSGIDGRLTESPNLRAGTRLPISIPV